MASITKDANGKIIKRNVTINQTNFTSYPTVGLGAIDNNYTANINTLNLNGSNVTATGTQLNYTNVTPGIASASKAVVLNSSSNISSINSLSCSSITVNGVLIDGNVSGGSAAYLTDVTAGTVTYNKSSILDSSANISGINSLSTNTLELGNNILTTNKKNVSYNTKNYISNTLSNSNQWNSMCWSPLLNLFVAVSSTGTGNRVMTSLDGKIWTSRTSAADNNWTSVCWSPRLSLFVAVASSGTGNRVMTSINGINWTSRTSAANNNWTSICWSSDLKLFVAVASSGTGNRVMSSTDGIVWTSRTSAADNNWTSVCWSPAALLFVAVASSGTLNRVMTSPDGINWTIRKSPADNNWTSICWGITANLFVAVASTGASNRVMLSNNGINWTVNNSLCVNDWNSIIWSQELNMFVAIASAGSNNKVATSSDGLSWSLSSASISNGLSCIAWSPSLYLFSILTIQYSSNVNPSTILNNWNSIPMYPAQTQGLNSVIWIDDLSIFVAVGNTGLIMTSYNGDTWTTRTPSAGNNWKSVTWSSTLQLMVAVSNSGTVSNSISTSSDGITWTSRTAPFSYNWVSVVWSSSLNLFAAIAQSAATTSSIMTSSDGITWTSRTGTIVAWSQIIWSPELSLFIIVGTGTNVLTSSDGITWNTRTAPSNSTWKSVTWSSSLNLLVAVADSGTVRCMTSSDGINWTNRTLPQSKQWINVCWSSNFNLFVAVSQDTTSNYVMHSSDGTNWTAVFSSINGPTWTYICFSPKFNTFVAVATSVSTNIMKTHNYNNLSTISSNSASNLNISNVLNNWNNNLSYTSLTESMRSVCWVNDLSIFIAVGTGGTILISSDGDTWTTITSPVNNNWNSVAWSPSLNLLVAVSNSSNASNSIITSTNGIKWSIQSAPYNYDWYSVCWSPTLNLFVAIAKSAPTSNTIMTSPNGITWTARTAPTIEWWQIIWCVELSIFVVVGTGTTVLTSSNGINWTSRTASSNSNWKSVAWSSSLNLFVAVADSGSSKVMTSSDGINWTNRTIPTDAQWWNVCWSPVFGLFVAVSANTNNNYYMYSSDGINWYSVLSGINDFAWNFICFSSKFDIFVSVANTSGMNIMKTNNNKNISLINTSSTLNLSNVITTNYPTLGNLKNVLKNMYSLTTSLAYSWTSIMIIPQVQTNSDTFLNFNVKYYIGISNTTGVAYSSDLITWTNFSTSGSTNNCRSMVWSPILNRGVIVSSSGTNNRILLINAYNNITTPTFTINNNWTSVCWSSELNLFVVVASSGYGNRVAVSIDGSTWKIKKSAADNNWTSVCWSSDLNLFVAVASSGTGNRVMTSSDGNNWISRTSAADNNWTSVCWSSELQLFMAVASSGTNNRIMKSSDGITWTSITSPADNNWTSIIWIPDLYIFAACASSGTNRLMYSLDGNTWNLLATPSNNSWNCIYWDYINSKLILIAPETTNNINISNIFKPNSNNTVLGNVLSADKGTGYVTLGTYTTPTYQFEYADSNLNSLYLYNNAFGSYYSLTVDSVGSLYINFNNNKPILNIVNHNGVDSGLALNGTLIQVTPTILNSLVNIVTGKAIASTPLTVDNNSNLSDLNQLYCTTLTLTDPFQSIIPGIAKISNPLITDSNMNITNINKTSSTLLKINNKYINTQSNKLENNLMIYNTFNFTNVINLNTYNKSRTLLWIDELKLGISVQYSNSLSCYVSTTTNGKLWTTSSAQINVIPYCTSLVWSPTLNMCLALGNYLGVATSTDLSTWTMRTGLPWVEWIGCWASFLNLFIIFGNTINGNFAIWTSPDGITWTGRNGPNNTQGPNATFSCCISVAYNVNRVYAFTSNSEVIYSTNGINWSSSSTNSQMYTILYNPNTNMLIGQMGGDTSSIFRTSTPAATSWSTTITAVLPTGISELKNIQFIPSLNLYVATGSNAIRMLISNNGTNWYVLFNKANIYTTTMPSLGNEFIRNIIWVSSLNKFLFNTTCAYTYATTTAIMGYTNSNQLSSTLYSENNLSNTINIPDLEKKIKKPIGTLYNSLNTWYTRSAIADVNWKFVNWFSEVGKFIAVGESQQYSYNGIMTSTDGKTWSQPSSPDKVWTSIAYSSSLSRFAVVGNSNDIVNVCFSTNGDTWTEYFGASANLWTSVCWSPELAIFVAVASSGTGDRVMTSANGMTWTSRTSAADNNWTSVCWSPELTLFVAVASSGTGNRVMTSPDGINWTSRTSADNNNWTSVCWNQDRYFFVAVASSGNNNRIMTSPDGVTWTSRTTPANYSWNSIIYANELNTCVAISNNTTNTKQNAIMISSDCYNWKLLSYRNATSWTSICWSPEYAMFVTVSNTGTANSRVNNSKMAFNSTKNTVIANPNTIYASNVNSRVGLGTLSPTTQLQLSTDSAAKPSTNTWTVSSDARLKDNIQDADIDICYNNVDNLRLVRYTWKDEVYTTEQVADRSKLGWIAQEVETVFPKAVEQHNMHGYEDCRTLDNDQIIASLYGCIQKLIQKCEDRQNTIDNLKNKYNELNTVFDNLEFVTE